jgi:hypothetical protein
MIESLGPRPDTTSEAAERGTLLHEIAATALRKYPEGATRDQINAVAHGAAVISGAAKSLTGEDIDSVWDYYQYCDEIRSGGRPGIIYIEHPAAISWIDPQLRGTVDFALFDMRRKELYVGDYKTGYVPVSAVGNEQLMFYALCLLRKNNAMGADTVTMFICQPNMLNWRENTVTVPVAEVLSWGDKMRAAYEASKKSDAPLVPGAGCKYCPAKGRCPAHAQAAIPAALPQAGILSPGDFSPPAPSALSAHQIADILDRADDFMAWIKAVRDYAEAALKSGILDIPGYKILEKPGRKSRNWTPEAPAALGLMYGYEAFSLRSVADLEKQFGKSGKDFLARYWAPEPGNITQVLTKCSDNDIEGTSAVDDFSGK